MTRYRTGLGLLSPLRTSTLGPFRGPRVYLGDSDSGSSSSFNLFYPLAPLASNAQAIVVTNTNISIYNRNADGTLGSLVNGDAGSLPTESATNYVGMSGAPAAAKKSLIYLNGTQDVEWILPGHPLNPQTKARQPLDRPFGLSIQGGRNHRMLYATFGFSKNWLTSTNGGTGQNTPTGSGYFGQWNRHLYITEYTGYWDIAYAYFMPGNNYEVFNVTNGQAAAKSFRFQRSRIGLVIWYNPGTAGGHDGGDPFQIYHGPTGAIQMDRVTIETNYQGIFAAWNDVAQDQKPIRFDFSNLNIRTINASGAWIYYNTKGGVGADAYGTGINVPPTTLTNVYVADSGNPTRTMTGNNALISTNGITPHVSADGATADWNGIAGANTTGKIVRVSPTATLDNGFPDFAPANVVGFDAAPDSTVWQDASPTSTGTPGLFSALWGPKF